MTNWLADPVACVIRLKNESGCTILAGRNEVLSRSTVCHRTEERGVAKWSWGHMSATRKGGTIVLNAEQQDSITFTNEHANVASDLLRAAYANNGGSSCGGKSMLELFWDELMAVYERLMTGQDAEEDVGIAQGLAFCIAVASNPYLPNIDAVRAAAAKRWEEMENEPPAPVPAQSEHRHVDAQSARRAARRARRAK